MLTMIFFPTLYEDELLYSAIARYHYYSGNENCKDTVEECFGIRTVCSSPLFPTNLHHLCERIPGQYSVLEEELINKHTLLPYYAPFMPQERYEEIKQVIKYNNGTSINMKWGTAASTIKRNKYLKYCPRCIEQDNLKHGEVYWHRSHQIVGSLICSKHFCNLVDSDISHVTRSNKHEFFTLAGCNFKSNDYDIRKDLNESHLNLLPFISKQTEYLLNNEIYPYGLENIKKFYVTKLQHMDLATYSGRIKWLELIPKFQKYFGEEFLVSQNCYVDLNDKDTWLHKLFRKPRVTCHPLRHILILRFLNETVQSMESSINKISYKPFGSGPWLCLNKAAAHYCKAVVVDCKVTRDYETGNPVGTFSCSCGFVFSRKGPDKTIDDKYRIGRIKKFGVVWEEKLNEVQKLHISLRKMSEILGVDPKTVKKKLETKEEINDYKESILDKASYRDAWLKLISDNKTASVTQIRLLEPKVYIWLYRNDHEWLVNNYPRVSRISNKTLNKVDWVKRDSIISKKVASVANDILNQKDYLIRVTRNEIGRRLGDVDLLYRKLDKLPETEKLLNFYLETIEQFQLRRILHIINDLKQKKLVVKEWEVVREAGLKKEFAEKFSHFIKSELR